MLELLVRVSLGYKLLFKNISKIFQISKKEVAMDSQEKRLLLQVNFLTLMLEIRKIPFSSINNSEIRSFLIENSDHLLSSLEKIYFHPKRHLSSKEKEEVANAISVFFFLSKEILEIDLPYLLEIMKLEGGKSRKF